MQRRDFIKTAAMAVAAAATVPFGTWSENAGIGEGTPAVTSGGRFVMRYFPYELKLRHAFNLARNSRTVTPGVQVEIDYDGVRGYGEASMPPYLGESVESVCAFLSKVRLDTFDSPFCMERIHAYLDSIAPGNCAAKAAVDIALHDICGKIARQPLWRLWGLEGMDTPCTSFTITTDTDEVVRRKIEEARPYRVFKVKMGVSGDRELVEMIRDVRPDVPLCVDVNQGWNDRNEALDMCHWLADRGCIFVEQPFDKSRVEDTAWLTQRSPLPVIADEAVQRLDDVLPLKGVYSGINIKLMKCGGLHEARHMATLARALGMKVMLGCMTETSCGLSAMAQLAPLADYADLDGNLLISNDRFEGMKIVDGRITLPQSPGIGVRLL